MKPSIFGVLADGREVRAYTLSNDAGMTATFIEYGAAVTALSVPDRAGRSSDVVLGYDSLDGYVRGSEYFGAVVGRYGNRIAGGRFTLDGQPFQLTVNDGANHLHGGRTGFNKVLWEAEVPEVTESAPLPSIRFAYTSPDGEEGYPGTVTLRVTYTLTEDNALRIDYEGVTDAPTILNPTQHSYFNLTGDFTRPILDHVLAIEADSFTPVDAGLIPTGELQPSRKKSGKNPGGNT